MSVFFLDSSALAKRYLVETGSTWITTLVDPGAGNVIFVAEITRVEVAAALAARQRAPKGISRKERDDAVDLLLKHCDAEYKITVLSVEVVSRAVSLTQRHRLRGYDAVQLATALQANTALTTVGLPSLTFVAADDDLVAAARAEGLAAENPNHYP
jgi:predicted nucleic acid-binding protein